MSNDANEKHDLVVIGAGFYGLATVRTYLLVNPSASVILLDDGDGIGGVWAYDRLYPHLKTNNQSPNLEFSDFPMLDDLLAAGEHIPGPLVNQYIKAYSEHYDLTCRIRLKTKVHSAEIQPDFSWILSATCSGQKTRLSARRLVVACGQTSQPVMPLLRGAEDFEKPIFHCRDYAARAASLAAAKNVVVFGSSKSAWDVAYGLAESGIQVHWVVRKSGSGPCYIAPSLVTPLKIPGDQMITKRLMTLMSPCIWGEADGYRLARWFLGQTKIGGRILQRFSANMQLGIFKTIGIDDHPETAKLKPWRDVFWVATNRGLLNYDNSVLEHVRSGRIKVYIDDVSHLSPGMVHLAGDVNASKAVTVPADALVCATGWEATPGISFTRAGVDISAELGLPYRSAKATPTAAERVADAELLAAYPVLRGHRDGVVGSPPDRDGGADAPNRPYMLHRFMVPPAHVHTRTVAFAGAMRVPTAALLAQAQALWITAFFGGRLQSLRLPMPGSKAEEDEARRGLDARVARETLLHNRFLRLRYPAGHRLVPDFFLDSLPLVDLYLRDLGLRRWRKSSRLRELLESYGPADYRGLAAEWLAREAARDRGELVAGEDGSLSSSLSSLLPPSWPLLAYIVAAAALVLLLASTFARA